MLIAQTELGLGANAALGPSVGSGARARPLVPTTSLPLNHSLQVGSHLPLQHRNSFCVSALSQPSLYSSHPTYSSADPFLVFADQHAPGHFKEMPSEVCSSRVLLSSTSTHLT